MGAVYLAHRADGQFEQKVAIKLIDLPLATDCFAKGSARNGRSLLSCNIPILPACWMAASPLKATCTW